MTKDKTPQNGGGKNGIKKLENVSLEFPATFQLKVVMVATSTDDENKNKISSLLGSLKIVNNYINSKSSSKGTYISYHYNVTLISKSQMETMYQQLKSVPGLKFAI